MISDSCWTCWECCERKKEQRLPAQGIPGAVLSCAKQHHREMIGTFCCQHIIGLGWRLGKLTGDELPCYPCPQRLGPPARCPFSPVPFFGWEGSPTKIDYSKNGTLILTSLLYLGEDQGGNSLLSSNLLAECKMEPEDLKNTSQPVKSMMNCPLTNRWRLWVKSRRPKWVALVHGNIKPAVPGGLTLTHTHVWSLGDARRAFERTTPRRVGATTDLWRQTNPRTSPNRRFPFGFA